MDIVSSAIQAYIVNNITLNQCNIEKAASSRKWFLTRLENSIASNTNLSLYSEPFVYFGSYFKRTKVKAVDEYDILVVFDTNTGYYTNNGTIQGRGLGRVNPNYLFSHKLYLKYTISLSPSKFLNQLKYAVQNVVQAFNGEAPERCGQAITATIKSQNLKIDLVPACIFTDGTGNIFYTIPKGDQNNGWIVTSPKEDKNLLNNVAEGKKNFKNVIRILKRIKETYNFSISSFTVETSVILSGQNYWSDNLYYDVKNALSNLALALGDGNLPDTYNPSINLISDLSTGLWYAKRIKKIIDELDKCSILANQQEVRDRITRVFENL